MAEKIAQDHQENQAVFEDQTNDRKYFSIIPNIIFEIGLSANEIAVYCFIKKVAGEDGIFYMGVKRIRETLKICNKTLKKIKETLIEKKLISVEIKSKEEGGQHITRILDIWPENMSHFKKQGGVGKSLQGCRKSPTGGCRQMPTKEELSTKEEPFKKNKEIHKEKPSSSTQALTLLADFNKSLLKNIPEIKEKAHHTQAKYFDQLLKKGYSSQDILKAIEFAHTDNLWSKYAHKPSYIKAKFTKLLASVTRNGHFNKGNVPTSGAVHFDSDYSKYEAELILKQKKEVKT